MYEINLHPSPQRYEAATTWLAGLDNSRLHTNGLTLCLLCLADDLFSIRTKVHCPSAEMEESHMPSRSEFG